MCFIHLYEKINNHTSYISIYNKLSNASLIIKNDNNKISLHLLGIYDVNFTNDNLYNFIIKIGNIEKLQKAKYNAKLRSFEFAKPESIIDTIRNNNTSMLNFQYDNISYIFDVENIEEYYKKIANSINSTKISASNANINSNNNNKNSDTIDNRLSGIDSDKTRDRTKIGEQNYSNLSYKVISYIGIIFICLILTFIGYKFYLHYISSINKEMGKIIHNKRKK